MSCSVVLPSVLVCTCVYECTIETNTVQNEVKEMWDVYLCLFSQFCCQFE